MSNNPGVDRKAVREEGAKCSGKVSDISRYLAYGIIVTCFTLLTSTAPFAKEIVKGYMVLLVLSAIAGCSAAVFDLLQYDFGYLVSRNSINNGLQSDGSYIYVRDWRYFSRKFSYQLKQILVIIGSCILVGIMFAHIISRHYTSPDKKPNRSHKAIQIEKGKDGKGWFIISTFGLYNHFLANDDAKKLILSNELIPTVVDEEVLFHNRVRATCDGNVVVEVNLNDSNLDSPFSYEFKCYDESYRMTLIESKNAQYSKTPLSLTGKTKKTRRPKRRETFQSCSCFPPLSSARSVKVP